jgi:non-reducing end alpha-L-arabinofuranosidase
MNQHDVSSIRWAFCVVAVATACNGNETPNNPAGSGGAFTGGAPPATGGVTSSGGITQASGGQQSSGGLSSTGGRAIGGANSGGVATGGRPSGGSSTGGIAAGGTPSGGASSGGVPTGGTATGGKATGGTSTGGTPTGGKATGGNATGGSSGGSPGPCDIYAAASTPCVAAHSTIRALFGSYSGKLYQIRNKAGTVKDINASSAGGFADSASQDTFCSGTTCVILYVYDQSGHGIDLTWQASDSPVGGKDTPASATAEKLTVSGHSVYSLYMNQGQAYWANGSTKGMPLRAAAETVYMVTSGTHTNNQCCFDYGNGETTRTVGGAGAMNALYFGQDCWFGGCSGTGPWVMIDPEGGLYPGGTTAWPSTQKSFTSKYVTAMMKNDGSANMKLKGADATTGSLATVYSGRPPTTPNQQGALTLGAGGDCCYSNTNLSQGTFYEGAIVAGYPSDATDDSVQTNVVATKYGQ